MTFLIAFLIIWTISPGPVVALTLNNARQYGYKAGVAVALGATVSTMLIWVSAVTVHILGLEVVDSADATLTQLIGGALIICLGMNAGYKAYTSIEKTNTNQVTTTAQHKRSFVQGMMILTASIPQSIIFYAILVPQTIASDNILSIIVGLGLFKIAITFLWHGGVAIAADRAQTWLNNPRHNQRLDFATALFMVAFGINILL